MNGREFVRRARRYAREHGMAFAFDPSRGKGSHGFVFVGGRRTLVKHSEFSKSLLARMLRELGIDPKEF